MANQLAPFIPQILAQTLSQLRENLPMLRYQLINVDYQNIAAQQGESVKVPLVSTVATNAVTPSHLPPASTDTTSSFVEIKLDYWQEAPLTLTDRDYAQIRMGTLADGIKAATNSLAQDVHNSILGTYKEFYGVVGTAGTPPFGSGTMTDAVNCMKQLSIQKAPKSDGRFAILDPTATAAAAMVPAFHNNQFSPASDYIQTGLLGRQLGIEWRESQTVPFHTKGTGAAYQVNGAHTAGVTAIALDTGTGTIVVGDILTFAGHTQTYTVTAGISGPGTVSISPALRVSMADNVVVTLLGSHTVNLVACKPAIAFVSRPQKQSQVSYAEIRQIFDPETGLALHFEMSRQHYQDRASISLMWGVKVVRPEFGVRLLG